MKKFIKPGIVLFMLFTTLFVMMTPLKAYAADTDNTVSSEEQQDDVKTGKAYAAAIAIGLAAGAGAIGMGIAIAKSSEGISRQPEAAGNIRTGLMLGLVFIETAIIYALIVAILIIFVL